jgi:hypothetical protein
MRYFRFSQRVCFWYVTAVCYQVFTDVSKGCIIFWTSVSIYWLNWPYIPEDLFLHLLNHFIVCRLRFNYRFYPLGPFWIIMDSCTYVTNSRINRHKYLFYSSFELCAVHHMTVSIVWLYRLHKQTAYLTLCPYK